MQTVSVILLLVLASTNASNYLHSLPRYQQDPREKLFSVDSFYSHDDYNDDYGLFTPKLTSESNGQDEWTSATDFRPRILQQLLTNRLTKSGESRSKRTEASLSIVNALDVLRQQLILELARRRMNESKAQIEKNRVLLNKTGKRSLRSYDDALGEILLQKRFQNEQLLGKSLPEISTKDSQEIATARKNTEIDPVFQT